MKRLLLWDIDLTLVDLRGLGGRWYAQAMAAVTGVTLRDMPSFPGRTELAITTELLTAHGVEPTDDVVGEMWRELIALSTAALPTLPTHGHALPGAAEALTTVAGHGGVVQSLVTGNLPEIARHKLSAFGLDEHVDFGIGGYGNLSAHRPDLVANALAHAERKHGTAFAPESVVVVGDTPHDVTAALHHGAVAVGVTTGRHNARDLHEAGAHLVLETLADPEPLLKLVSAETR